MDWVVIPACQTLPPPTTSAPLPAVVNRSTTRLVAGSTRTIWPTPEKVFPDSHSSLSTTAVPAPPTSQSPVSSAIVLVAGSRRHSLTCLLTQTAPAPTAKSSGSTWPVTGSVACGCTTRASSRDTVWEVSLATQIDPNPAASRTGLWPTPMVPVTVLVAGSTRDTVPWAALATQTAPSATSTSTGPVPTGMVATTRPNEPGGGVVMVASRSGPRTPTQARANAVAVASAVTALTTPRRRRRRSNSSRAAAGSTRVTLRSSAWVDARP